MKQYKIRPGVVLLEVCGEHLLVATRDARETCPYLPQLSEEAAVLCHLLEQEGRVPVLTRAFSEQLGMEPKDCFLRVTGMLSKLVKAGYVLAEDIP